MIQEKLSEEEIEARIKEVTNQMKLMGIPSEQAVIIGTKYLRGEISADQAEELIKMSAKFSFMQKEDTENEPLEEDNK